LAAKFSVISLKEIFSLQQRTLTSTGRKGEAWSVGLDGLLLMAERHVYW